MVIDTRHAKETCCERKEALPKKLGSEILSAAASSAYEQAKKAVERLQSYNLVEASWYNRVEPSASEDVYTSEDVETEEPVRPSREE